LAKTFGAGSVTALGTATASAGVVSQTLTGGLTGSITITVTAPLLTSDTTTFTVVAGAADHVIFIGSTGDLASGHTRTLTVEIRDSGGNLVTSDNSTAITFSKTSGSGTG